MNFDSTGLRLVAKHHRVVMQGRSGLVVRLCRGWALVRWDDATYALPERCSDLAVI